MPAENIVFESDIITASDGTQYRVEGSANVYYRGATNANGFYTDANYDFKYQIYDLNGKLVSSGSLTSSQGDTNFTDGKGNYTLGKGDSFSVSYSLSKTQSGFQQNPYQATFTATGFSNGTFTGTGPVVSQEEPVCFTTGTLIRTTRGEVPVETLAVGDLAVTASGGTRPIVWIGHRVMGCTVRAQVCPVRVRAGAFGSDDDGLLPARDLWLSPGHPVRVGEDDEAHLVPIMCLVNGTTIERVPVDSVTYWHVELDQHDLLLAEGLAAESYLDWGDRPWFANAGEHALMNPDFVVPGLSGRCLPVAIDGPVVEAARRRLDAVFAMELAGPCAWPTEAMALAV